MLDGGAVGLAEARISNVEKLRKAGITNSASLIHTPMSHQASQVVRSCDTSYNSEMEVIARLANTARKVRSVHRIMLMVKMGDMRDGIMPENVEDIARQITTMPGVILTGIGANFACLSGTLPDAAKMTALSAIASDIEAAGRFVLETVSGGNSANLSWALGPYSTKRNNNLRLGEARRFY